MKRFAWSLLFSLSFVSCSVAAEQPTSDATQADAVLLVGNKGEDTVSFINLATGREIARRNTGKNPHEVAISPDQRLAAIVSYGAEHIDIFDIASHEKTETIALTPGKNPHGIVWLSDGRIIATTEGSDSITVVSAPTGETQSRTVANIATGQKGSHMLVVSPDAARAFVTNMQSGTVSVIDLETQTKLADLAAGTEPEGLAITPDGKSLWVADRKGDALYVFDTTSFAQLAMLKTGKFPIRVAISPDGKTAVTSNLVDGALSLFDVESRQPKGEIKVSGAQQAGQVTILFSPDGSRLYVAETGLNRIAEIDMVSGKLIGRLAGGTNGDGLGIAKSHGTSGG